MRFQPTAMIAALAAVFVSSTPALASQWQKLSSGQGDKVEVDLTRVTPTEAGRVQAWSRLSLSKPVADEESGTTYNVVEVLNSYDCTNSRYAAVKRLYLNGDTVLKAEPIYGAKDQTVGRGVDGALLKEVCRSRPSPVAAAKGKDGKASGENRFSVMHAEMVTNGKDPKAKPVTVASVADKPADSGKTEAPKRMIEMPRIDPSQVEKPTDTKPGEAAATAAKPPVEKAPEKKAPEKVVEKPVEKPVEKSYAAPSAASVDASFYGLDKRTRELALATAGPRRIARKKAVVKHEDIHWSYEGDGGPANWAKIDSKNSLCATGQRQSPIDIGEGIKVDQEAIRFDYRPQRVNIEDNGHTIQVNVNEGNTIRVMGRTYELKQLHFHRPSEEKVSGKRFDMVVHLVHKDDEGHLAVVAILLERGETEQPVVQTIWNNLPLEAHSSTNPSAALDVFRLLPTDRSYYTYMGSLTTPPCSEGVLWMVFKQPVIVTPEQIAVFSRLYKNNARPIQPANGRLVKETR